MRLLNRAQLYFVVKLNIAERKAKAQFFIIAIIISSHHQKHKAREIQLVLVRSLLYDTFIFGPCALAPHAHLFFLQWTLYRSYLVFARACVPIPFIKKKVSGGAVSIDALCNLFDQQQPQPGALCLFIAHYTAEYGSRFVPQAVCVTQRRVAAAENLVVQEYTIVVEKW